MYVVYKWGSLFNYHMHIYIYIDHGSRTGQVKSNTIKLGFVASPVSTQH
jgi:hypothetical protein